MNLYQFDNSHNIEKNHSFNFNMFFLSCISTDMETSFFIPYKSSCAQLCWGYDQIRNYSSVRNYFIVPDFPCPDCRTPHPDCSMCMAYKQMYGNRFMQHRFSSDIKRSPLKRSPELTSLRKTTPRSKTKVPRARARIPITSPISSDEDEDRYRAALAVSSERRNSRPKMFHSPVKEFRTPSKTVNSNGSLVRGTVKELLKKNDSVLVFLSSILSLASIA